jgi:hypothetical protein
LLQCFYSAGNTNGCPFDIEEYSCVLLIYGKYVKSFDEEWIHEALITFPTIAYFLSEAPLDIRNNPGNSITITTKPNSFDDCENKIELEDFECCIKNITTWNVQNLRDAQIETYPTLRIHTVGSMSLTRLSQIVKSFSDFFTIASLTPTQGTDYIVQSINNDCDSEGSNKTESIRIIFKQDVFENKASTINMLLRYPMIKDSYPMIMKKWFEEKNIIGPIEHHLIDVIIDSQHYSSTTFLIILQAIEGFYYRFIDVSNGKTTLTKLLEKTLDFFEDVNYIKDIKWDIPAIVDSRHYYSHFVPKEKKPKTLTGIDLTKVTFKLRVLLICCTLHIMGLENSLINSAIKSCYSPLIKSLD